MNNSWQEYLLPASKEGEVWELFHENSKLGRLTQSLSDEEVLARMKELSESLPFVGYPIVELPLVSRSLNLSLDEAIVSRITTRELAPQTMLLEDVACLLYHAYGQTRDNKETDFPRPFRVVPSAGAMYPLEIFLFSSRVEGLLSGLYHYNPAHKHLRLLAPGDHANTIADTLVQPELAHGASLIIFITALFERSVSKYGNRGYRFALLEAGHVGQNINLASTAMGLGSVNIGGYFDRETDDFLGLDGISHSTIYVISIGKGSHE